MARSEMWRPRELGEVTDPTVTSTTVNRRFFIAPDYTTLDAHPRVLTMNDNGDAIFARFTGDPSQQFEWEDITAQPYEQGDFFEMTPLIHTGSVNCNDPVKIIAGNAASGSTFVRIRCAKKIDDRYRYLTLNCGFPTGQNSYIGGIKFEVYPSPNSGIRGCCPQSDQDWPSLWSVPRLFSAGGKNCLDPNSGSNQTALQQVLGLDNPVQLAYRFANIVL